MADREELALCKRHGGDERNGVLICRIGMCFTADGGRGNPPDSGSLVAANTGRSREQLLKGDEGQLI